MILLPIVAPASSPRGVERLDLGGAWRLTQADRRLDLPARVPGSVHTDLLAAGAIPDPFYRDDEKAVQWVGEVPWTYARTFAVPPGFRAYRGNPTPALPKGRGLSTIGAPLALKAGSPR